MATVHEAARRNDVEALRLLLNDHPELVEDITYEGRAEQPLFSACRAGSTAAARLLLDRGAGIDTADKYGVTALMCACGAGRVEVVSMLLARGADPALCGSEAWTALMYAANVDDRPGSDHVAVIRLLLKDGRVRINARNEKRRTALWLACSRGHTERARVLLMEGFADYTIGNERGMSPMRAAEKAGHEDIVQLLEWYPKWYEGELERAYLLSKARAVVEATEIISKAPRRLGVRGRAQQAREAAAPPYLKRRVARKGMLPLVVVQETEWSGEGEEEDEEEYVAMCEYILRHLKDDLFVELMAGVRLRRHRTVKRRG